MRSDSLRHAAELRALLDAAGFADVRVKTVTRIVRFACTNEHVRILFAATFAAALSIASGRRGERVVAWLAPMLPPALARYSHEKGFAFPQEVHSAPATA